MIHELRGRYAIAREEAELLPLAERLAAEEATITGELLAVQGHPVDIGGYYMPDVNKLDEVMRPSQTLNAILASGAA